MAGNDYTLKLKAILDDESVKSQLKVLSNKQKVTIQVDGTQVLKTTKQLQDDMGKVYTSVEKVNTATGKTTSSLTGMAKETAKVDQGFTDIIGKVAKFGLAVSVIHTFTEGIRMAVEAVFDFDKALTEFNKVADISGTQVDKYTDKLADMGKEVARTRTEMLEASGEAVKAGFSEDDAASLAKVATMYQNVADAEMSAGDAMTFLVSQQKAFKIPAQDAIMIIDKVNEVSNKMSVSSVDMATSLTKTSSAMSVLGNSFDETLGLVASGVELMPKQAGKVSRG